METTRMKELMQRVEIMIDGWNEYAGESNIDRDDLKSLKTTVYNAMVHAERQKCTMGAQIEALTNSLQSYAYPMNWTTDGTFRLASPHSENRPDCGDRARDTLERMAANYTAGRIRPPSPPQPKET
jgi:hypothetical protein